MASFRSSVNLAAFYLVLATASIATRSEPQSNCRTSIRYHTDEDSIARFKRDCKWSTFLPGYRIGEESICGLKITWMTCGRIYKLFTRPVVFDGLAELSDIDMPFTVVVRCSDTYAEARRNTIDALVDHLASIGLIEENPCYVRNYPTSLVNIDGQCPPNSTVPACTECTFLCTNAADANCRKSTTVRCCGNGQFDDDIPPCEADQKTVQVVRALGDRKRGEEAATAAADDKSE